ncbi:MAG: VWA domain-containing protein [Chlamydiales bacterium]|nr:VWA domain-containing protein [Chlamydiales bacterium]
MTESPKRRSAHQKIFAFTVVATLLIHTWALYTFQGIKMTMPTSTKPLMEAHLAERTLDDNQHINNEEARRNLQLAAAFVDLTEQREKSRTLDTTMGHTEEQGDEIAMADTDEITLYDEAISFDESAVTATELQDFEEDKLDLELAMANTSQRLPTHDTVQILHDDNEQFTTDLIQATEIARGTELAEEDFTPQHGIQIGSPDADALAGNDFEKRTGLLNQGETNPNDDAITGIVQEESIIKQRESDHADDQLSTRAAIPIDGRTRPVFEEAASNTPANSSGAIASSDDFYVDISYAKKNNSNKYLFRILLTPKDDVAFKKIKQNVYFLVDRSHSIREDRFYSTVDAVAAALYYLKPNDTFNVIFFDKEISAISSSNIAFSPMNVSNAADYIKAEQHGGIFASTDLYRSLRVIVPTQVAPDEVNTAILFSDGNTVNKPEKQRRMTQQWIDQNRGKVSLYCVAAGEDNDFALLDLISQLNRGTLHVANSNNSLTRTVINLMKGIQTPIVKDIAATAVYRDGSGEVALLPSKGQMHHMYQNIPYTIYGETDDLKEFHLILQGKYYDKWVNIKRIIDFKDATNEGADELNKMWALNEAYIHYNNFLHNGDRDQVATAKKLLAPYKIPAAF